MRPFALSAAAIMLSVASVASAAAGPFTLESAGASSGLPVVQAGGCHRDVRNSTIPQLGKRAPHYHVGDDCRTVLADGANSRPDPQNDRRNRRADCHRDVRLHRVDGQMLLHRHVGPDCAIRIVRRSN
jgi:hypothetical protein